MAVLQRKDPLRSTQALKEIPIRMVEVELGEPLPIFYALDEKKQRTYQRARCLVRLHTRPVGLIELHFSRNELKPNEYAPKIWQLLQTQINAHLKEDNLPFMTKLSVSGIPGPSVPRCIEERENFFATAPFVSVIVPTHERIAELAPCLKSILSVHYPRFEVIVVDNAPKTNATAELVEQLSQNASNIRYVREERQGPSWARNRGIGIAKGEILAFTDDDVVVDSFWLVELVRGFSRDTRVSCVTGLVLPMEIETTAQYMFEETGGYDKGYERRAYKFNERDPHLTLHPYIADRFGTGANMALTADFIRSIGGFDPALGRVGPVRCAQDIAVFFQVLAHGNHLVYEPASFVYHLHRREFHHLRKQSYNHAVGYSAYLTKSLTEHPGLIPDFIKKVPYALFHELRSRFGKSGKPLPQYARVVHKELVMIRRKGLLYGPLAYVRSRWQVRKQYSRRPMENVPE